MSERTDKDFQRTAEKALDRLSHGWNPLSLGAVDEDEPHVVAQLEALSLLAYAVEPEAPSAGVKTGLLRAVGAEPRLSAARSEAPDGGGEDESLRGSAGPVDVTLQHGIQGEADPGDMTLMGLGPSAGSGPSTGGGDVRDLSQATVRREVVPPPPAVQSNTPLYLLAAGLVFCLVGLGYLYGQLEAQNAQGIARRAQLQAEVQQARAEAEAMRERVNMVTNVARVAYPMRQVSANGSVRTVSRPEPGEVRPDGIVYVCGQHQRWYLSLTGFEPAPPGKVYHLWFQTEDGSIDAGPLEFGADGRVEVSELSMPAGTRGFLVSLEDAADADDEPHGQIILQGEQPVAL